MDLYKRRKMTAVKVCSQEKWCGNTANRAPRVARWAPPAALLLYDAPRALPCPSCPAPLHAASPPDHATTVWPSSFQL
ncbi:hypothetical protein E2C01_024675 [Portunus trituberculatus]|uniref:Uncharacterized protein n=1 Tax=Portunus trituberculatus TaxID=210409 RepID=A0A5B7EDI6_PORTR|nr:hypothetical protein [Portunus trituberculatus]